MHESSYQPEEWGKCRLAAAAVGAAVAAAGCLTLVGWWLDVAVLKSVFPRLPNMAPNTALALLLAGIALGLSIKEPIRPARAWLARAFAAAVALIGAATLTEYVLGQDWHIDRLLLFLPAGEQQAPLLGRPGFPSAWSLLLLGCALCLIDVRPGRFPEAAQLFTLLAMTMALLALTGYACNVPNFYGVVGRWPGTGMALHTAMLVALLGVGIVAARPQRGLMALLLNHGSSGVVARELILVPVAIPLALGLLHALGRRAEVYAAVMEWGQLGNWVFSTLNIFVSTTIIWWIAAIVNRADRRREDAEAEQRKLNEQLEVVNSELEERVMQRTAELQAKDQEVRAMSQQLWQAAKLATMGELAASVAHELNNPLSTVNLHLESLRDDAPPSSPTVRRLQVIEGEVDRMADLVGNLLRFSHPGQQQVSTLNVHEELDKTLEVIRYHLLKCKAEVVRSFGADVPLIQADRQKFRQVFLNLFLNAVDAMPRGGTVTVRTMKTALEAKPAVAVEVADTGIGIEAANLARIMEPFFTTKPEGKGTGLGLAICRRMVAEHHGTIEVASEVNRGTTVRVSLPVANGANGRAVH